MRLNIKFLLLNEDMSLPLEYRRFFLSILKNSFEKSSKDFFDNIYDNDKRLTKPFTFSFFLNNPEFKTKESKVILKNNLIIMNFSSLNYDFIIHLYNGLIKKRDEIFSYNNNFKVKLLDININRNEKKINSEIITFRTLSPIVVREHNKEKNGNKDIYHLSDSKDFDNILINNTLRKIEIYKDIFYKMEIIDKKLSKVAIKHYNHLIFANNGIIKIHGDKELLNFIYLVGLGSRTNEGFGMLEVIE